MRRLSLSRKKVRGIPRRLRALARWAEAMGGRYPAGLTEEDMFWNFKIPAHQGLLDGRQATAAIRRECAQRVIDAGFQLLQAKPASATGERVVATICVPELFGSEVCIYSDLTYLRSKIEPSSHAHGSITPILERSLAADWGLNVPAGMQEIGVIAEIRGDGDPEDDYRCEYWFYGELD